MWACPTRKEVGWFFDEQINQTVFKYGKLSSEVQARFEEIGKWLRVHCEPQIKELEKRMDAMLREREVKNLRAKGRKVKNLRAKPKRPVNIKKEVVHPHLIPLEDWLKLKNQGGKEELLAFKNEMWASEVGPRIPVLKINDHATGGRRTKDILGGPKGWGPKKKVANAEIYVIFEVFAFCGGRTKTDFKDRGWWVQKIGNITDGGSIATVLVDCS